MPARSRISSHSWGIAFMLINVLCWGAALPISKPAVESISPFVFLFYRFSFAGLLSLPIFAWFLWKQRQLWRTIVVIIGVELVGTTLALAFLYEGLARTSSLEASLITTTTPVFIILGGVLFLREKQEKQEWLGLVLALAGTLLLTLEPFFTQRNSHAEFSFVGNVLVLLQNVTTMVYFLLAKRWYQGIPKFFVTAVSFWVGSVSFALLNWWQTGQSLLQLASATPPTLSALSVLLPILYMATFGSIIGLTAYFAGQERMEASEASLFTYLQPLVYIPLAGLWLHEQPTTPMVLAIICIVGGVWVAEGPRRPFGRRVQRLFSLNKKRAL